MILVTVSSVMMAQEKIGESVMTSTINSCSCPVIRPAIAQKPVVKTQAPVPVVKTQQAPRVATFLPYVGWPDWVMGWLVAVIILLALVVMFLLGRVTAPMQNMPQVMAPVVYIQPPAPPPLIHRP